MGASWQFWRGQAKFGFSKKTRAAAEPTTVSETHHLGLDRDQTFVRGHHGGQTRSRNCINLNSTLPPPATHARHHVHKTTQSALDHSEGKNETKKVMQIEKIQKENEFEKKRKNQKSNSKFKTVNPRCTHKRTFAPPIV